MSSCVKKSLYSISVTKATYQLSYCTWMSKLETCWLRSTYLLYVCHDIAQYMYSRVHLHSWDNKFTFFCLIELRPFSRSGHDQTVMKAAFQFTSIRLDCFRRHYINKCDGFQQTWPWGVFTRENLGVPDMCPDVSWSQVCTHPSVSLGMSVSV